MKYVFGFLSLLMFVSALLVALLLFSGGMDIALALVLLILIGLTLVFRGLRKRVAA